MANKHPRATRAGRAVARTSPRLLPNATVTVICVAIWATAPTVAHKAEQARPVHIRVDDYPRPVAAAIRQVEQHFRWVVTYEDTRYLHPGDIVDVTEQIRRDPARPGRIFQMRNGSIDLRFRPAADTVEFQVGEVLNGVGTDLSTRCRDHRIIRFQGPARNDSIEPIGAEAGCRRRTERNRTRCAVAGAAIGRGGSVVADVLRCRGTRALRYQPALGSNS